MENIKISNKLLVFYTLGIISSLVLIKLNFWPAVFLYPFLFYSLVTQADNKKALVLSPLFGFLYFIILYSWATTTGLALSIYGALLCAFTFFSATFLFIYFNTKIKNKYINYLLWPLFYVLIGKIVFYFLFFDISFFLHAPALLVPLSSFIGSEGVIIFIQFVSICLGKALIGRKKGEFFLYLLLVSAIIFLEIYLKSHFIGSVFKKNNLLQPQVTLLQTSKFYKQNYKSDNALEIFKAEYKNRLIAAGESGSKIIVIPEDPFVFTSLSQEQYEPIINEIASISKKYDTYIFFSVQRKNSEYKTESQGHVFSPENGLEEIYVAQKNYGKIAYPDQYREGTTSVVYKTRYGNVLLLICFEELFRELVDDALEKSPVDYIIIVSNNQFFPDHTGIDTLVWNAQNLSSFYKTPVFMSSNIGPTMIFNQYGQIVRKLDYYIESEITYSDQ